MLNHIVIMGRLTRDPETRFLQSSTNSVTRFSVAVERDYKPANAEKPEVDYFNCVAWNKTGEFVANNFRKGNMIAVTGSMEFGSYTNKEGFKTNTADLKVSSVYFTGEKRAEAADSAAPPDEADGGGFMTVPEGIDEELPFN